MMSGIDFYNTLKLPKPVLCGLVHKITSPKGMKKFDETIHKEVYHLHNDLVQIWPNKPNSAIEPGLYWVMDLFRNINKIDSEVISFMQWNHYIVVLNKDLSMYVVAEFLDCHDSEWIKSAIPVIKKYFKGEKLKPMSITTYKNLTHKKQQ